MTHAVHDSLLLIEADPATSVKIKDAPEPSSPSESCHDDALYLPLKLRNRFSFDSISGASVLFYPGSVDISSLFP